MTMLVTQVIQSPTLTLNHQRCSRLCTLNVWFHVIAKASIFISSYIFPIWGLLQGQSSDRYGVWSSLPLSPRFSFPKVSGYSAGNSREQGVGLGKRKFYLISQKLRDNTYN